MMTVSLFGPVLVALLALVKLARNDLARYSPQRSVRVVARRAPGDGPAR